MIIDRACLEGFGIREFLISRIEKNLGEGFILDAENLSKLRESDFPIHRLLKSITDEMSFDDFKGSLEVFSKYAPGQIFVAYSNELSDSQKVELILADPVYCLQHRVEDIPDDLFMKLLEIEPRATLQFASEKISNSKLKEFAAHHPQIIARHKSEVLSDEQILTLAETDLRVLFHHLKERSEQLGIDFSPLYHSRHFDLGVPMGDPAVKVRTMNRIAEIRCRECNFIALGNERTGSRSHEGRMCDHYKLSCMICKTEDEAFFYFQD